MYFSNERRESVMNYSEEWLQTLKYYRANWESIVYPFTYKRAALRSYYGLKQLIQNRQLPKYSKPNKKL